MDCVVHGVSESDMAEPLSLTPVVCCTFAFAASCSSWFGEAERVCVCVCVCSLDLSKTLRG